MLGFASFAAAGGIIHVWQRIPGARFNEKLVNHAYWLLLAGVSMMVVDLTIAGLVEAQSWQSGAPWMDSVRAARPYWLIRVLTFIPIAGGFASLFMGLLTGDRNNSKPGAEMEPPVGLTESV
jgi:cbb3-type cytochrome oxidase subunit 1